MIIEPKIDKLVTTVRRKDLIGVTEEKLTNYCEEHNYHCNVSSRYVTISIYPTMLKRKGINYDKNIKGLWHNTQMNIDLLQEWLVDIASCGTPLSYFNVKELHIAKDRVMEHDVTEYNKPLTNTDTKYNGKIETTIVDNGINTSVYISNESDSDSQGVYSAIGYPKSSQLQDMKGMEEIIVFEPLTDEEIQTLGEHYNKENNTISLEGLNLQRQEIKIRSKGLRTMTPRGGKLLLSYMLSMIEDNTLLDVLEKTFVAYSEKTFYPQPSTEPTIDNDLDRFLVSGDMRRFDTLFKALDMYSEYKKYMRRVLKDDDIYYDELYQKFHG